MGVTIHYRGSIDSLESIEEMEDRMIDLVFALFHGAFLSWVMASANKEEYAG